VEIENNGKSNGYEIFHFGGLRFYNYRKMRANLKINTGRGGGVLKREGGSAKMPLKKTKNPIVGGGAVRIPSPFRRVLRQELFYRIVRLNEGYVRIPSPFRRVLRLTTNWLYEEEK